MHQMLLHAVLHSVVTFQGAIVMAQSCIWYHLSCYEPTCGSL